MNVSKANFRHQRVSRGDAEGAENCSERHKSKSKKWNGNWYHLRLSARCTPRFPRLRVNVFKADCRHQRVSRGDAEGAENCSERHKSKSKRWNGNWHYLRLSARCAPRSPRLRVNVLKANCRHQRVSRGDAEGAENRKERHKSKSKKWNGNWHHLRPSARCAPRSPRLRVKPHYRASSPERRATPRCAPRSSAR